VKDMTMRKWYSIADINTIPRKEGRRVDCGDFELALFNLGDKFVATDNRCPHKGGPLADGIVAGKAVFCPLHNWKINLENGCALTGGEGCVKTYPVKAMNGKVYVALEEGMFHQAEGKMESVAEPSSAADIN